MQIATIEYPNLDIPSFLELLDSHARELRQWMVPNMSGVEWVAAANEYMFENLGFAGNQDDYYNARNSCLNEVLLSRTGIPITLAIVYMEVARRLNKTVHGISLPGHFLVRYDDEDYSTYIDCFHSGRLLNMEECRDLAMRVAKVDVYTTPEVLEPASSWHIAVRMLNNLRGVYYRNKDLEKAIAVLDLLIEAAPLAAEEYKQRGVLKMALQRRREALADLERYVALAPTARDRAEIETHIESIRTFLRSLQ